MKGLEYTVGPVFDGFIKEQHANLFVFTLFFKK